MIKVNVVPFASGRGDKKAIEDRISYYLAELRAIPEFDCSLVGPDDYRPAGDVTLLLALGGGIEPKMLTFLTGFDGPALILAHPGGNAVAAALEVLSFLNNMGRQGRIVQALPGWQGRIHELAAVFAARTRMRGKRIGVFGMRTMEVLDPCRMDDEVRRVWGACLVRTEVHDLVEAVRVAHTEEARDAAAELEQHARAVVEPDRETLVGAARIYLGLRNLVDTYHLDAVTVKCFDLLPILQNSGCYALARLNEEGIPAGCEADVLSTVGMLLMRELTGQPSFMANPSLIDQDRGVITFAHCTIARTMTDSYTLRSHLESGLGVGIQGNITPGPVTVTRLGGPNLDQAIAARGSLIECGSRDGMCRTQLTIRFDDPKVLESILAKPLGNHHLILVGDWQERILEFMSLFIQPQRGSGSSL